MKKPLLKFVLPLAALLLSSCQTGGSSSNPTEPTKTTQVPTSQSSSSESSSSSIDTRIFPTSLKIASSLTVNVDATKTLSLTYYPTNTNVREATWSSSDSKVATVENGKVTGIDAGKCDIVVKAFNRYQEEISATCKLTVIDPSHLDKTKLAYTYDDYTNQNVFNVDNCPLEGEPKLLIIPVWFNDSSDFIAEANKENVRDDIRKAYIGTNTETGWRSVKTFYAEESQNKMVLDATVTDWYNVNASYKTYGDNNNGQSLTTSLVSTASNWYFTNNPSDSRKNYDTNGDGYLDGIMLIYAAPDYYSLNDSSVKNLWAYCFWVQSISPSVTSPTANVFFWASYDFMYSTDKASSRTGKSSYGNGDTRYCNVDAHTFIHEMGHVLGLQDYYDYSGSYSPTGRFTMQDNNVGGHDPYSVMAYGWADPYIPTQSITLTINDFQSSHDVVLLANHTVNSPFDEYLLVELYTPTGLNKFDTDYQYRYYYPKGVNAPGIRVWHIDARLAIYNGYSGQWSTSLTTNAKTNNIYHAMSNSYDGEHGSYLGSGYYDYNILQLIRNSSSETYKPTSTFSSSSMFYQDATFNMSTYKSQFVGGTKMNDGKALGWSFTVNELSDKTATITFTKA